MTPWWFRRISTHRKRNPTQNVLCLRKSLVLHAFRSPPTGHAKHKEIIRETVDFCDAWTIFQENCNRMKIFEEESCFWREFHEWLMTPWWFRRRSTHRKRKSNAECTFPREISGISCFSQPPTGHAKHKEIMRKTVGFHDARTIFKKIAIGWRFSKRIHVSGEDSMNDWRLRDDSEEDPRIGRGIQRRICFS